MIVSKTSHRQKQLLLLLLIVPFDVAALGNHPESSTCQQDTPWYAVCTSSVHSLEGWTGNCFKSQSEAEQEANRHSNKRHNGNMRWTGIATTEVSIPISQK